MERNTIYHIYETEAGVHLGKGRQIIRAAGANGSVAENLQLPNNAPVLQLERKTYSKTGELVEYMILTYEASRYSFQVELDINTGSARDFVPDIERRSL